MTIDEILKHLENAKIYLKANKKFLKKFIRYYTIVSSTYYNYLRAGLLLLSVVILILGFVMADKFSTVGGSFIVAGLVGYVCCFVVFLWLGNIRKKLDYLYEKYSVGELVSQMTDYMCGLHQTFWKTGDIKELVRLLSSKSAADLKTAASMVKPRCKVLTFDMSRFHEISKAAVKRQSKRNKNAAFWQGVASSAAAGSGASSRTASSSNAGQRPLPYDPDAAAKQKKREEDERKRKLADYARQADWWEKEYRRLYAIDPNHYKTKDAEYNKNYFRRLSKGGS